MGYWKFRIKNSTYLCIKDGSGFNWVLGVTEYESRGYFVFLYSFNLIELNKFRKI